MRRILLVCLALLPLCTVGVAQTPSPTKASDSTEPRLRVAALRSPPFSWQDESGFWQGIAVALWAEIAQELHLSYDLVLADAQDLVAGVAAGRYAVGIGALSVTPDREGLVDFTHPFFSTGLGMAVHRRGSVVEALHQMPWRAIALALGSLLGLTMLAGALVWLAERRINPDQFGGPHHHGIGAGLWWAAVTLTTVGYGDKAPRSVVGRTVAIIWMLTSLILTASFTATITSALTVNTLNSAVKGPADLPRLHVGAVAGTSSIEYLDERRISYLLYPDATQGLHAVARGVIDTYIADKPLLQFRLGQLGDLPVQVMPHIFGRQDYSFAIPNGSSLRPAINKVLLRLLESPGWSQLRRRYLGDD
jgi:ABC-type amino acid transport substrate-binding protein